MLHFVTVSGPASSDFPLPRHRQRCDAAQQGRGASLEGAGPPGSRSSLAGARAVADTPAVTAAILPSSTARPPAVHRLTHICPQGSLGREGCTAPSQHGFVLKDCIFLKQTGSLWLPTEAGKRRGISCPESATLSIPQAPLNTTGKQKLILSTAIKDVGHPRPARS